jgi:hypothetical protein
MLNSMVALQGHVGKSLSFEIIGHTLFARLLFLKSQ